MPSIKDILNKNKSIVLPIAGKPGLLEQIALDIWNQKAPEIERSALEKIRVDVLLYMQELKKLARKGDVGPAPSDEKLLSLIMGVMPDVKDGHTPTEKELSIIFKKLFTQPKDATSPTRAELLSLIKEAMPKAANYDKRLAAIEADILSRFAQVKKALSARQKLHGGGMIITNSATVTVTRNSDGTYSLTSAGGTGGYTVETPSGLVDSSNTTYTVSATPVYIVSDGGTFFSGKGYSIVGLTITMDTPPSSFIRSFHS